MAGKIEKRGSFNLDKAQREFETKTKRQLPLLIANQAVNHFDKGFRNGGGQTDASKAGWKERAFTKGKGKRAILVKSGRLRRDIQRKVVNFAKTVIGTTNVTKDYADIHNEGGKIRITAKMRKFFWAMHHEAKGKAEKEYWKNLALTKKSQIEIPKREYIGRSKDLEKKHELLIDREIKKIFKK
jgi:phage gpG-like protein